MNRYDGDERGRIEAEREDSPVLKWLDIEGADDYVCQWDLPQLLLYPKPCSITCDQ
jgi:hypothetical protein